jgi:hypothetical protein
MSGQIGNEMVKFSVTEWTAGRPLRACRLPPSILAPTTSALHHFAPDCTTLQRFRQKALVMAPPRITFHVSRKPDGAEKVGFNNP